MNLPYKIWYGSRTDPRGPATRYGIVGGLREYHILWLLINDRKARDRNERKAHPIERGRSTDPPFCVTYPHSFNLEMIISGRKPEEIEPQAGIRTGLDNLRRYRARHPIMSNPYLRITGKKRGRKGTNRHKHGHRKKG